MGNLHWDQLEIIECLEAAPEYNEQELRTSFKVVQERLMLLLTIWEYDSLVQVSLYDPVSSWLILEFRLYVWDGIYKKSFPQLEVLEIRDCTLGDSSLTWTAVMDPAHKINRPDRVSVEISIKPQIRIGVLG